MEVTLEQVSSQIAVLANQIERMASREDIADLKHQARLHMEELKTHVTMAAEGYGGTLEGIQRELVDLNKKFDTKFGDHAAVLADHNRRIITLEKRTTPRRGRR